MRFLLLPLFAMLFMEIAIANEAKTFDVPAGLTSQIFENNVSGGFEVNCELNLNDFRYGESWGPAAGLHFLNEKLEQAMSIRVTKSRKPEVYVFTAEYRENRETKFDHEFFMINKVSNSIKLSLRWDSHTMLFHANDGLGQRGSYYLSLPEFTPESVKTSVSGLSGVGICQHQKI